MKHAVRSLVAALFIASPALAQPADKAGPDQAPAAQAAPKATAVNVIDAGAEPRRALRYTPTKGDAFGVEMRMKMSMVMDMNGQKMPNTAMPEMVVVGDSNVLDVASDGNVRLKFVYGQGRLEGTEGVMPMVVSAMKKVMDNLPGVAGEFVFTNRGNLVSGSFTFPEGMDPGTRQQLQQTSKSMEQLTLPLPVEPIGKGAKWTADREVENNGIRVKAVYTHEVTDLSDTAISVKVSLKGGADKGSLPGGVKFDSFTMSGGGEQRMDLRRMLPSDGRFTNDSSAVMDAGQGKMTMNMSMVLTMKQTEPGKGATAPAPAEKAPAAADKEKAPRKL